MERRRAITVAGAAALTMLAGATGIAINSGIVDANHDGNVGTLTPVEPTRTAAPQRSAVGSPAVTPSAAPAVRSSDSRPVTTSAASSTAGSSARAADDRHGHGDEYEGANDDD